MTSRCPARGRRTGAHGCTAGARRGSGRGAALVTGPLVSGRVSAVPALSARRRSRAWTGGFRWCLLRSVVGAGVRGPVGLGRACPGRSRAQPGVDRRVSVVRAPAGRRCRRARAGGSWPCLPRPVASAAGRGSAGFGGACSGRSSVQACAGRWVLAVPAPAGRERSRAWIGGFRWCVLRPVVGAGVRGPVGLGRACPGRSRAQPGVDRRVSVVRAPAGRRCRRARAGGSWPCLPRPVASAAGRGSAGFGGACSGRSSVQPCAGRWVLAVPAPADSERNRARTGGFRPCPLRPVVSAAGRGPAVPAGPVRVGRQVGRARTRSRSCAYLFFR